MGTQIATVVAVAVVGACLVALGLRARRDPAALVPEWLPDDTRARRVAVVRRGGGACLVAAAGLVLVGVLALV